MQRLDLCYRIELKNFYARHRFWIGPAEARVILKLKQSAQPNVRPTGETYSARSTQVCLVTQIAGYLSTSGESVSISEMGTVDPNAEKGAV